MRRVFLAILRRVYFLLQFVLRRVGISLVVLDSVNLKRFYIGKLTPTKDIDQLVRRFRPVLIDSDLIRIGSDLDGGYLLPNDLQGVSNCFSAGCDNSWEFEKDLWEKYQIKSHIVDSEDKRPTDLNENFSYTPKWLGPNNSVTEIRLEDWINRFSNDHDTDLILQMDIEGSEWLIINELDEIMLNKFRIIVVEFHNIAILENHKVFSDYCRPLIERLTDTFNVVHFHPNNCCGFHDFNGKAFPKVFEVTFYRKSIGNQIRAYANLPHKYDRKNVDSKDDISVNWDLF